MAAKYIVVSTLGAFAFAYISDNLVADKKIFGGNNRSSSFGFAVSCSILLISCSFQWISCSGTTPSTVLNSEWWEETDKKFQAWPRTAGPPVVMNPISRQNFIVKTRSEP